MRDTDVPQWWAGLGLPGLIDIHTHFLPERMLQRVWAHFDESGPLIGRPWPITYRRTRPAGWPNCAGWGCGISRR